MQPEDLRCFCSKHTLLARVGQDKWGKPYVQVKSFRQQKVFAEVVVHWGVVRIRCRDCNRFHTVRVRHQTVAIEPAPRSFAL